MTSKEYRALARQSLKGKWRSMYALMLIASLFSQSFFLETVWENFFSKSISFLDKTRLIPSGFGWVLAALSLAVTCMLYTVIIGQYAVSESVLDGQTPTLKQLLPMKYFWKALLMNIVMYILVFLQFLLLIVPGVVALFGYIMAPYLLLKNPQLGPVQALKESRRRMKGHKFDYVWLCCSFIGWMALQFAAGILARRLGGLASPAAGMFLQAAVNVLAGPPLLAYMNVAYTAFLRDVLKGDSKQKT